jgi:hypothetical protein
MEMETTKGRMGEWEFGRKGETANRKCHDY